MKIKNILLLGIAPAVLMAYGWTLGQLHMSGYDVAGIALFVTGAVGLVLALLLRLFTRRDSWHSRWFASLITGVVACGIAFGLILLLARLHG